MNNNGESCIDLVSNFLITTKQQSQLTDSQVIYNPVTNCHRLTCVGQTLMSINDRYFKEDYYCVPRNKHKVVIGYHGEAYDFDLIVVWYECLD